MLDKEEIIKVLDLRPLKNEGGYFRETYRSKDIIPKEFLPSRYSSSKRICTSIYFLITPSEYSLIHRVPTDEMYHFYSGVPVTMVLLYPDGTSGVLTLGPKVENNQHVQFIVPQFTWQGCFLKDSGQYALMGTTMAPGFDDSDLEMGEREELIKIYPDREELIIKLTRESG
jgi:predicted cupin superfamily sugar epimerase